MSDAPVSVVTGANSGIGRATAIHLAQQGHTVYGTVRATSRMDTFHKMAESAGVDINLVELDVADDDSVAAGFEKILGATGGRVDVLVNNAGVGGNAVAEEATPELYLDVMNINLCGAIRCLKHVLPGMRERRSGAIVNVTSLTGKVAAIGQSPYVASKHAFEGVSEGLAQELAPFGIRVAIIEPGVTKSAIFAKSVDAPNSTGAYDAPYRRMFQFYARGIAEAADPMEVAEVIYEAITTDQPKLHYVMSWGGQGMIDGRNAMSDADWVELGAIEDDMEYYARFQEHFGVDIAPR
jgi:NAD(P)-dependent dehydrogenase (short-subunit alcohol dehydrogenase family)